MLAVHISHPGNNMTPPSPRFLRPQRLRRLPHATLAALLLLAPGCADTPEALSGTVSADTGRDTAAFRGRFQRQLLLTGELEAVRSLMINAPQTSIFQMRITFLAEEGEFVRKGDPLLDFDNSALADRVLDLETQILDAETQVVAKQNEIASALKDLEIELANKEYARDRTRLDAEVDPAILSRQDHGDRQLAFTSAQREFQETQGRVHSTGERGQAELDVLTIQRDKLQHDLQSATNDRELLSITAPADGLMIYEKRNGSDLRFQEGDSCWPGQRIARLPDLSRMQVAFSVSEVDARLLQVGMQVVIAMDSFPETELSGEILQIASMAVNRQDDSKVRIFKVTSSLSETMSDVMKPGMSVLGRVVVDVREEVPLVARRLVHFDGQSYWLRSTIEGSTPMQVNPVARNGAYYVLNDEEDGEALAFLGIRAPGKHEAQARLKETSSRGGTS